MKQIVLTGISPKGTVLPKYVLIELKEEYELRTGEILNENDKS
jgi:hypothetical protein